MAGDTIMDKTALNKLIAEYIVGIGVSGIPNSHLWMQVDPQMQNLDRHQAILGALKGSGLVKESGYFLTLTEKGLEMYRKIAELFGMTPQRKEGGT